MPSSAWLVPADAASHFHLPPPTQSCTRSFIPVLLLFHASVLDCRHVAKFLSLYCAAEFSSTLYLMLPNRLCQGVSLFHPHKAPWGPSRRVLNHRENPPLRQITVLLQMTAAAADIFGKTCCLPTMQRKQRRLKLFINYTIILAIISKAHSIN